MTHYNVSRSQKRPSRGEGRLLGDLRPGRRRRTGSRRGATRPEEHRRVRQALARLLPGGGASLLADRESLTVYLRFPREHWNRIRHSNFIERTFGETRRRVKVIGRLPGEHSCLSLVWAVLDRASTGWRGFTMTPAGLRLLADLRRSLHDPPTQLPQPNSASRAETALAPTDSTAVA